eukprot:6203441-Pleurochrysis_carterae.AAC.1
MGATAVRLRARRRLCAAAATAACSTYGDPGAAPPGPSTGAHPTVRTRPPRANPGPRRLAEATKRHVHGQDWG